MTSPGLQPSALNPQPLLLAGPTAVGKSEVALLLAEKLNGEIVTVDSMQVYRGLDIGTAKPSPADRARVPHHLIDVVGLTEPFDAAQFTRLAHKAVAEIQARGRVPILCGGTGLYFKAFLEGLGEAPPADPAVRSELEATPLPELLKELEQRDPATLARIDRQNPRRVIRAVEVIRLTGRPFSVQRARWGETTGEPSGAGKTLGSRGCSPHQPIRAFGLSRSPADLLSRIDVRVEAMFRRGLVAETAALLERGLAQNQTAMQAIGYRQVVEHLRGVRSLPETIALVKIRTRQFAKRQMTWFRRQLRLEWIGLKPSNTSDAVAALVKARLSE
jgi:tRNA dimethylallyltransferase